MTTVAPRFTHADDPVTERHALYAGIFIALVSLGTIAAFLKSDPETARNIGVQWLAHTAFGKETSVPTGLVLALSPTIVALAAFAQDAVVLLVGYPLVLMLTRGTLRWPRLRAYVHRPHPRRTKIASRTETAGITLLALAIWIPFLPSAGLVTALIGRAAGYRPRIMLPVFTASALISAIAYTIVYVQLETLFSTRAILILAVLGAIASLAVGGVAAWRKRTRAQQY